MENPKRKLTNIWEDYEMQRITRTHQDAILKLIVVVAFVVTAILILFAFTSKAEAARPTVTPVDVNSIQFVFDPNLAGDIMGWGEAFTNSTWKRTTWLWCSKDTILACSVSHGTILRQNVTVDPNFGDKTETYEITYQTPTAAGVQYIKVIGGVANDPNNTVTRTFLLNVKQPPTEIILWTHNSTPFWLPSAITWLNESKRGDKGKIWQEWQKAKAFHVPKPYPDNDIERHINDSMFIAHILGKVGLP
jgi:hypothetical protein